MSAVRSACALMASFSSRSAFAMSFFMSSLTFSIIAITPPVSALAPPYPSAPQVVGGGLAALAGGLHEGQAVVRVEVLEHLHRGPKHLNRLLVVGLRRRVLGGLLRALVVRVLLGLVQIGDLRVGLLDALVRLSDLLVQTIHRRRVGVDLLRELVELVVVLGALGLAHLLLRRVVLLLLHQVRKHVFEVLGHRREVRRALLALLHLARERDEAEVRGLDTRAAEHVRGRLRLRGGVLAHRKEVRLEEGRALRESSWWQMSTSTCLRSTLQSE